MSIGAQLRPDIADVIERWEAFWAGEGRRPLVWGSCIREGPEYSDRAARLTPPYPVRPDADFAAIAADLVELFNECCEYVGDEVPAYAPSFGPDQFAAFLGVKIEYSADSAVTNWSIPLDKELEGILPIALDEENPFLTAMDAFISELARAARGRFVVASLDYHSNLDALTAMRGPENLCVDIIEKPELVEQAMAQVTRIYRTLYDRFHRLGNMAQTGTCSWMPAYSPKRFAGMASDFICLLSPEMGQRFVMPALEEELSALDNAIFHLDGPGALPHLDNIISLDGLRAIQWVPGDGSPQHGPAWFDLYKRILKRGKGLWIYCDTDTARVIHAEIRSPDVIYFVSGSAREVRELVKWLDEDSNR